MPFEPLGTDEKTTEAIPKKKDFEVQMMGGCMVIGLTSVLVYILACWPFVAFPTHTLRGLSLAGIFGLAPACVLGLISTRRFGLAGGSGFLGGAMTVGVFIYLLLSQNTLRLLIPDLPAVEYPAAWSWMIPLGWVVVATILMFLFLPGKEFESEGEGEAPR